MAAEAAASPEETLAALLREAAALRQRLQEENHKADDVSLVSLGERLEPLSLPGLKLRRVLKGHQSKVLCVDWAPDRRRLASSAQDGRLLLWDAFAAAREHAHPTGSPWALACAYAPSGTLVAAGGLDNKVTLWAASGEAGERRAVAAQAAYVAAVAFPRSERQLLVAGGDGGVALWDVEATSTLHAWAAHAADATSLHVAPGASADVFASGAADRAALVWDARAPQPVRAFTGHDSDVTAVRFHPSGDALATACDDSLVRVWELRADRELARYGKDSQLFGAASVEWSASGRLLFAGYGDHTACAWDALRTVRVAVLCGHEHRVTRVQLSPDASALATASWDATIRIWA